MKTDYENLLKELKIIPYENKLLSPVLDYIIGQLEKGIDKLSLELGSTRCIVTMLRRLDLDERTRKTIDSCITLGERKKIEELFYSILVHTETVINTEESLGRVKNYLILLLALFKSWKSLGTSEYNERVLEIFTDIRYTWYNEEGISILQEVFEILSRPIDTKKCLERRYLEGIEEVVKYKIPLDINEIDKFLGEAVEEEEKWELIERFKKEQDTILKK